MRAINPRSWVEPTKNPHRRWWQMWKPRMKLVYCSECIHLSNAERAEYERRRDGRWAYPVDDDGWPIYAEAQ